MSLSVVIDVLMCACLVFLFIVCSLPQTRRNGGGRGGGRWGGNWGGNRGTATTNVRVQPGHQETANSTGIVLLHLLPNEQVNAVCVD